MSEIMVRERFLRSGKKYMSIHLRWQVLMEKESINQNLDLLVKGTQEYLEEKHYLNMKMWDR